MGFSLPTRFNSRHPVILGMTWRFAVQLPKPPGVLKCHRRPSKLLIFGVHRLDAGDVGDGPEEHGGVAIGKHKPVAVGPDRVLRVKTREAIPNRIDQWRPISASDSANETTAFCDAQSHQRDVYSAATGPGGLHEPSTRRRDQARRIPVGMDAQGIRRGIMTCLRCKLILLELGP
jgi:hypothetical protein